jgi:hypothetical protein
MLESHDNLYLFILLLGRSTNPFLRRRTAQMGGRSRYASPNSPNSPRILPSVPKSRDIRPSHLCELLTSHSVMLSGIIPMVTVAYISGPFVNYIHLRLPAFARGSREMLLRYSKKPPKDAEIDITTMNFIGKPRITRMKATDLYPVKERLGMANYARDTTKINAGRRWWMGKVVRQFGVHSGRSKVMGGEIWRNVESVLQKNRAKE